MKYVGTVRTHKSFDAEQIDHDSGTGEVVVLRGSDWLIKFIRTDIRAEEDSEFHRRPVPAPPELALALGLQGDRYRRRARRRRRSHRDVADHRKPRALEAPTVRRDRVRSPGGAADQVLADAGQLPDGDRRHWRGELGAAVQPGAGRLHEPAQPRRLRRRRARRRPTWQLLVSAPPATDAVRQPHHRHQPAIGAYVQVAGRARRHRLHASRRRLFPALVCVPGRRRRRQPTPRTGNAGRREAGAADP